MVALKKVCSSTGFWPEGVAKEPQREDRLRERELWGGSSGREPPEADPRQPSVHPLTL